MPYRHTASVTTHVTWGKPGRHRKDWTCFPLVSTLHPTILREIPLLIGCRHEYIIPRRQFGFYSLNLVALFKYGGCVSRIELVEPLVSFLVLLPCLAGVEVISKPSSAGLEVIP
jgi:hypothetical protein